KQYEEYTQLLYEHLQKKGSLIVEARLKTKAKKSIDAEISVSILQQGKEEESIDKMELIVLIRDLSKIKKRLLPIKATKPKIKTG
ncbi:MAG: hypothetical protein ACFFBD_30395, partial [Candidatus Hodarchaeota archaeon]